MPFWGRRSRFPWTNNNNQESCPTETKDHQLPLKSQIPKIQESTLRVHRIFELLPKLHTQIGKTTHTVLPATQKNRRQNQNTDYP